MAILFTEGFDIYKTIFEIVKKWSPLSKVLLGLDGGSFSGARVTAVGGQSYRQVGDLETNFLGTSSTIIAGFGYKNFHRAGDFVICELKQGSTVQVELRLNTTTGLLSVVSNNITLGTGSVILSDNTWYYLEFMVFVNAVTGTVDVRVNETSDILLTNQDTLVSVTAEINTVRFTAGNGRQSLDDIVILDTSGTINNTFLGDVKIETLRINGAGNATAWDSTPGVDDYISVREESIAFIGSSTTNDISQFTKESLVKLNTNIRAVVTNVSVKNSDSTPHAVRDNMRIGATDYPGTTKNITSTIYENKQWVQEVDPSTATTWASGAAVNAAQVGIEWLS